MAPKLPLGNPPPASSSDEEDDDEEESSDEEVEEQQEVAEDEEESPAKEPAAMAQASESEDESDSSMDSDETLPSPTASAFTIKPIADKPVQDSVKPKKRAPAPSTPIPTKRPAETPTSPEPSRKRKAPASAGEDKKKGGAVQRVWSDEDVITVLEGLIEFQPEKEADPSVDFYEFIKESISFDVSKTQLNDKINSLKKKYQNNARKGQDGEDPVFSKPHDYKSFQLSKTVWGADASDKKPKNAGKSNTSVKEERSFDELMTAKLLANADEFWSAYPSLKKSIELMPQNLRSYMKDSMGLVRRSKVKELDDKWRKLNEEEFELYLTRTKLFLDMSQASGFSPR